MRALVLFSNLLVSMVVGACQASTEPTVPAAKVASSQALSPRPTSEQPAPSTHPTAAPYASGFGSASATSDSAAIAEAGRALLEAEKTMMDARVRANTKYCVWKDTSAPPPCTDDPKIGKPYWAAVARAVQRYLDALRTISFPPVAKSEARTEMDVTFRLVMRARDVSQAVTTRQYISRANVAQASSDSESAAVQRLKGSLGLPVGP